MSDFQNDFHGLELYFKSLLDYAKDTLSSDQQNWSQYPIYLRATGGMRLVPYNRREEMMIFTRQLFSNKTFCPFFFQYDFARVMSGEEEAVYSWTTANYLFGTLLHNMNLPGYGPIISPINTTYGIVDLGGASTQISFFVPSQDISEGLFKLQLGSQRHWNVYSKSFLSYGHNAARERHIQSLIQQQEKEKEGKGKEGKGKGKKSDDDEEEEETKTIKTPCFFSGYDEKDTSISSSSSSSSSSNEQKVYKIRGPHSSSKHQYEECYELLHPLLRKELNVFCNEVYDNQCSMDGFYQPTLPINANGHFVASATYKYVWSFLDLPPSGNISFFKKRAQAICEMDYKTIKSYSHSLNTTVKKDELLPYYCFLASYVAVLLESKHILSLPSLLSFDSPPTLQRALASLMTKQSMQLILFMDTRSS
jgi:Golgi nucleoside diphosphatase